MLRHVPFFSPLLLSFVVTLIIKCNLLQTNVLYHEGYDSSNDHQYSHGPCNTQYVRIFIVLHVCACLFISGKGMDVGGGCGGNSTVVVLLMGNNYRILGTKSHVTLAFCSQIIYPLG